MDLRSELFITVNGQSFKIHKLVVLHEDGQIVNPGTFFSTEFPVNCHIQQELNGQLVPLSFNKTEKYTTPYYNTGAFSCDPIIKYDTLEQVILNF